MVDTTDSKSVALWGVPVQVRPEVPFICVVNCLKSLFSRICFSFFFKPASTMHFAKSLSFIPIKGAIRKSGLKIYSNIENLFVFFPGLI